MILSGEEQNIDGKQENNVYVRVLSSPGNEIKKVRRRIEAMPWQNWYVEGWRESAVF